jgi:murein DD-endopeptidase MepM/ murein hydrolase activator NlpD
MLRTLATLSAGAVSLALASCAVAAPALGAPAQLLPPLPAADDIDPFRPDLGLEFPGIQLQSDTVRLMRFPVDEDEVTIDDTFGACRGTNCERTHMGSDLFAPKLTPVVAAQAGRVTWFRSDATGTAGNGIGITDAEGWRYLYLHINNDTPGTDDGANPPEWRFAPGIEAGATVEAGDLLGYLGDSGNAETTPPHVHFELRTPGGRTIDPYPSLRTAYAARTGVPVDSSVVGDDVDLSVPATGSDAVTDAGGADATETDATP